MQGSETAASAVASQRVSAWPVVREALAKIGLALAALLIGTLLLELLVRTFLPQLLYRYPKGLFINDAAADYRLTPGFSARMGTAEYSTGIQINAAGLRDSREVGPKAPGTRRILVLGDSFAMGHSVEEQESFVRLVENGLNAAAGRTEFTVLNSGVPGYNTRQEIDYLNSRGFALEPDAVVLAFFTGNDIVDNADRHRHYRVVDGYLVNGNPPPGILPWGLRSFLVRNSHLYQILWPIERRIRGIPKEKTEDPLFASGFEADDASWSATQRLFTELAETVRAHHLPLFIAIIPDLVQVEPEMWSLASQGRESLDPSEPDRRLTAIANTEGLPVLDLYPTLRAAAANERLYFPIDHHFTRAGNRVAAAALTPFLWEHLSTPR